MYAAAASAQLRPEPGTPGAEALGYFATLDGNSLGILADKAGGVLTATV